MKARKRLQQSLINVIFILITLCILLPFLLLIIASFTDEMIIIREGYSFLPSKFSLEAYEFLWKDSERIGRAYLVTFLITAIGTTMGVVCTSCLAYPMSRSELPGNKGFAFYVFFTMLFNGGLVPTYMVYTQVFGIKNTIWALIIPGLLVNGFNVMIMRTFFRTSIPKEVIESASIDGAGELRTFVTIVLPLSLPILATIGLMMLIAYWNDWYNGLIYLTDQKLFSLQNLLNRILLNAQFLASNASSSMSSNMTQSQQIPMQSVRMAMAVIGALPLLCVYPFFQKYFVKGLTIGAVKG